MNGKLLKEHCERMCKAYERAPTSNTYLEHKFVLDLLNQAEWIPVSERLPEKTGWYLCTFEEPINMVNYGLYVTESGAEKLNDEEPEDYVGWQSEKKVIAWSKLPSPYKEKVRDKE